MKPIRTIALLLAALLLAGCNMPANQNTPAATQASSIPGTGQTPASGGQPVSTTAAPGSGAQVLLLTRDDTNARTGPGTDYPAAYLLPAGLVLRALGRSADNAWLVVTDPPDELDQPALWVSAEVVEVRGDLNFLEVVAGPAQPTGGAPTPARSPTP